MAFINDEYCVVGQIVKQCGRRLARLAAGQKTRIVLDPFAVAKLLHHLYIEPRTLFQALRLDQFVEVAQDFQPFDELEFDFLNRIQYRRAPGDVVAPGIDGQPRPRTSSPAWRR